MANSPESADVLDKLRYTRGVFQTPSSWDMYYECYGNSQASHKVLLIMGFMCDAYYWDPLLSKIGEICGNVGTDKFPYDIAVFDNRGCGRSSDAFSRYSTSRLAADCFGLLRDELHWTEQDVSLHLAGWSLGGMICQELALLMMEQGDGLRCKFATITLMNTSAGGLTDLIRRVRGDQGLRYNLSRAISMIFKPLKPRFLPTWDGLLRCGAVLSRIRQSSRITQAVKLHYSPQHLAEGGNFELLRAAYKLRCPFDRFILKYFFTGCGHLWSVATHHVSDDRLGMISIPTLLLCSQQDPLVPFEGSVHLQKSIKNNEIVTFHNTGHMSFVEHPIAFTTKFLNHISSDTEYSTPSTAPHIFSVSHKPESVWYKPNRLWSAIGALALIGVSGFAGFLLTLIALCILLPPLLIIFFIPFLIVNFALRMAADFQTNKLFTFGRHGEQDASNPETQVHRSNITAAD